MAFEEEGRGCVFENVNDVIRFARESCIFHINVRRLNFELALGNRHNHQHGWTWAMPIKKNNGTGGQWPLRNLVSLALPLGIKWAFV